MFTRLTVHSIQQQSQRVHYSAPVISCGGYVPWIYKENKDDTLIGQKIISQGIKLAVS